MIRVIFEPERGQRVPVRVRARAISDETVRQFQKLASQPYVVEFVHCAGRVMRRKEARASIRRQALARAMRRVAYPEHPLARLVEEAPDAYRDVREVLGDQEDLVRRRIRLEPGAVLKG